MNVLYINAYLVAQVYSGPEEGGTYHNVGNPLASIPIPAKRELGKCYYVDDKGIHISTCPYCNGTGDVVPDEENEYGYLCSNENPCSYIPEDLEATHKVMMDLQELFKDSTGRYECIRVSLESKFAESFNTYRRYE